MKMYPNEAVAPLMDVDTFWHYHILDTMKYAQDCQAVFGYFLHHFPYVGLRGQDDLAAHARMGERMRDLYEETFGEKYRLEPSKQETVAFSSAPGGPSFSALEQVGARRKLRTAFSAAPGIAFSSASGQSAGHKAGQHASRDGLHPAFLSSQVTAFSCASGKTAGQFSMATEERTMDAFYSTRPRL
jgi:hypothetical protein